MLSHQASVVQKGVFAHLLQCIFQEYDPMHADELMIQFAMDQAPKFLTLFPEGITLSEEVW